jgi:ABC-type glycerol-3-phosphate transport system substrate-binding protein
MNNYQDIDSKMLAKARVLPTKNAYIMEFCDMWAVALQEMWMGTKTVQEALDDLAKKADNAHFFE